MGLLSGENVQTTKTHVDMGTAAHACRHMAQISTLHILPPLHIFLSAFYFMHYAIVHFTNANKIEALKIWRNLCDPEILLNSKYKVVRVPTLGTRIGVPSLNSRSSSECQNSNKSSECRNYYLFTNQKTIPSFLTLPHNKLFRQLNACQ